MSNFGQVEIIKSLRYFLVHSFVRCRMDHELESPPSPDACLPLPDAFRCQLTVKIGKPLGKSRTSIGQPTIIMLNSADSYGIVKATLVDAATNLVGRHHAQRKNIRCEWDPATQKDVYVKCTANSTQDKYKLLDLNNYHDTIRQVWDNVKKIRNGQATFTLNAFIYVGII